MRYFTVTYWTSDLKNRQEKRFPTQHEALRYIMILDPRFRVQIDDHDDAIGG